MVYGQYNIDKWKNKIENGTMNFLKKYVEKPNILVNQIEIYVEGKNSLNGTLITKYNPTRRVRQQSPSMDTP